jgi:hypothetical protein
MLWQSPEISLVFCIKKNLNFELEFQIQLPESV